MKILIDARYIAFPNTGLGRFTFFLSDAFIRIKRENTDLGIIIPDFSNDLVEEIENIANQFGCILIRTNIRPFTLKNLFLFSFFVNKLQFDAYLHPHFDIPFFIKKKKYCIIYDVFVLVIPNYILKNKIIKVLYFKMKILYSYLVCERIFSTSYKTIRDILSKFNLFKESKFKKIDAGPTVKPDLIIDNVGQTFSEKYLLYVGDRRPHKNLIRITQLYNLLQVTGYDGKLFIVGSTRNYDEDLDILFNRPGIHIIGNVDDVHLSRLYRDAQALIFLSSYEGFGLPVVEAAAFNKKMILSDGGSLPEITPDWAYVMSNNEDIYNHVSNILIYLNSEIKIDSKDYLKKYNWEAVATNIWSTIYDQ